MHAVLSHPAAMRYWSSPPHVDIAETRAWLDKMIAAPADQADDFIIERLGARAEDHRVIGKAGCWRLPEIGYILHPDYWGQGLAAEALHPIIGRLFSAFALDAIEADVDPRNTASLKLLARLGFVETRRASRTWKVGEEWCDSIYLALRRPPPPGDA